MCDFIQAGVIQITVSTRFRSAENISTRFRRGKREIGHLTVFCDGCRCFLSQSQRCGADRGRRRGGTAKRRCQQEQKDDRQHEPLFHQKCTSFHDSWGTQKLVYDTPSGRPKCPIRFQLLYQGYLLYFMQNGEKSALLCKKFFSFDQKREKRRLMQWQCSEKRFKYQADWTNDHCGALRRR